MRRANRRRPEHLTLRPALSAPTAILTLCVKIQQGRPTRQLPMQVQNTNNTISMSKATGPIPTKTAVGGGHYLHPAAQRPSPSRLIHPDVDAMPCISIPSPSIRQYNCGPQHHPGQPPSMSTSGTLDMATNDYALTVTGTLTVSASQNYSTGTGTQTIATLTNNGNVTCEKRRKQTWPSPHLPIMAALCGHTPMRPPPLSRQVHTMT